MLDFNRDILPYLSGDGPRHAYYQASIAHRDRLRQAFRRAYPVYLDLNRPNETKESKLYRRVIYKNPFRPLRNRYIETLDYISKADDFVIQWPAVDGDATDTTETYCNANFSSDGSVNDWYWRRVRPLYVHDPNAVLLVLPLDQPESDTVRAKPRPVLIPCDKVYQHKKGRFCVVELPRKSDEPRRLAFVDADSYAIATYLGIKSTDAGRLSTWNVTGLRSVEAGSGFLAPLHNCPVMPAWKLGKLQDEEAEYDGSDYQERKKTGKTTRVVADDPDEEYYESPLSPALECIEAAQQNNNDADVETNLHVSSEKWEYATRECPSTRLPESDPRKCYNGTVTLRDADGAILNESPCTVCGGHGTVSSGSATGKIIVTAPTAQSLSDEGMRTNLPIPPGGYIPRSIEPLKALEERYARKKAEAYATLNMQFLEVTPTTASGTSKRFDREELYRELNTQASHLCALLQQTFDAITYQRYGPDAPRPVVIEPVRFSLENAEETRQELIDAVKNNFDANLRKPLEKKLISYQTGPDSDEYRRYELRERLDPYPNLDLEKKLFLAASIRVLYKPGSAQLQLAIEEVMLSAYFEAILNEQLRDSGPGFWLLDNKAQYTRMMESARKRVGPMSELPIDPATGKPINGKITLEPPVDFKNTNQVN
ncbi:hypothetical protein FAES_1823 [Fibrella aestuarina BUZ 2]|uniref:Uncharacterized protein n=1 Tax=Fibrella aestuarina BUZ 2 TaxID=1166018 RepID=I0K6T0_9BACT|nr:hypothetical protein [Fibrella aestuarina]CCG99833.1 hypothetical protein FAES_1823 [Fibrella aestuarina BUZ 2]